MGAEGARVAIDNTNLKTVTQYFHFLGTYPQKIIEDTKHHVQGVVIATFGYIKENLLKI